MTPEIRRLLEQRGEAVREACARIADQRADEGRRLRDRLGANKRAAQIADHCTDTATNLAAAIRALPLPPLPEVAGDQWMPDGEPVRLDECPPGLFVFGKTLCFRSEYLTTLEAPRRYQPDAYVVASGEYFWGGAKDSADRSSLMVQPVSPPTSSAASGEAADV